MASETTDQHSSQNDSFDRLGHVGRSSSNTGCRSAIFPLRPLSSLSQQPQPVDMDNDKIVFYRAPVPSRSRNEHSQSSEASNQPQQWVRFREYQPKGQAKPSHTPKSSQVKSKADWRAVDPDDDAAATDGRQKQRANVSRRRGATTVPSSRELVRRQQLAVQSSGQPLLVLSSADPDPFNALPSKTDPFAARMLQLYIDRDVLTAMFSRSIPLASKLWLEQRKQKWLPLAMSNTATFNALILYMETAPGMPTGPGFAISHRRRLAMAYSSLNEELQDPERAATDATAFAVVLLMHVAEHMDDFSAFCAHGQGLEAIVAKRMGLPPTVLPRARPKVEHIDAKIDLLARREVFRPSLIAHLRYWHAMSMSFRVLARDDWIIGLASQHMMTTGFPFDGMLLPIEEAYAETVKLNAARMFPNRVPSLSTGFKLQACVAHIKAQLEKLDMAAYMQRFPDLMIWSAVVVGPVATEPEAKEFFAALLRTAVHAMGNCSYEEANDAMRAQSLLPTPFDDLSRQFYDHVIGMRKKVYDVPEYLTQEALPREEIPQEDAERSDASSFGDVPAASGTYMADSGCDINTADLSEDTGYWPDSSD